MSDLVLDKLVLKKVLSMNELSELLTEVIARRYQKRLNCGKYKGSVEIDFDIKNKEEQFVTVEIFTEKCVSGEEES